MAYFHLKPGKSPTLQKKPTAKQRMTGKVYTIIISYTRDVKSWLLFTLKENAYKQ